MAILAAFPAPAYGQHQSAWEAVELFRLGGLEAPETEQFTNQLISLSLGPNEQVFVLDLDAGRIQVFSALDGSFVRTISRPGQGPGEILGATGLGWDSHDQLWVKEPFARRFSVFDSIGTFIRTVPRSAQSAVPSRTGRVAFNSTGQLVEMGTTDDGTALLVFDPESGTLMEEHAALPEVSLPSAIPRHLAGQPEAVVQALRRFRDGLVWEWSEHGRVWFSWRGSYQILEVGPSGDTVRVIESPRPIRAFSPDEQSIVRAARHHLGSDDLGLSPPQVQSIIRLVDGRFLVQTPAEMNEPGDSFDLLSAEGDYLGSISMPVPVWPRAGTAVRGDRVFLVGRGEFDVPLVLAIQLVRRSGL